jgi:hypothetical protein
MPAQQTQGPNWQTIKQDDFSGGVNFVDDPGDLEEKEVADALNVRLTTRKIIEQRPGFTQYNSSAIGASTEIRSLFNFLDFSGARIPLAQVSGSPGALYKGSAAYSGTGSWSSILTETASAKPAFFDAEWGIMIYVNGVDVPMIWEGTYGMNQAFRLTTDSNATPPHFLNFDTVVTDKDPLTYAQIGGLDTVANHAFLVARSRVPKLTGFKFTLAAGYINTTAATIQVEYWSGSAWTAVSGLSDGTAVAGATLAQSGDITFTEATTVAQIIDGYYGFWFRISVSAALSADVRVVELNHYYNIQALQSLWDGTYNKPDFVQTSLDTNVTFQDLTYLVTTGTFVTPAALGAFPLTTGYLYVKSFQKFRAVRFSIDPANFNTTTATLSAEYTTDGGKTWSALTIVDGTSANSITFAQTGVVTFNPPSNWTQNRSGSDQLASWQVRFKTSATFSTTVNLTQVDIILFQDVLKVFDKVIFHKNRVFLAGRADGLNYLFFSGAFEPDVWTGVDTGNIGVPSGKPITALCRFYNELFVATDDEIYLLEGYSPTTFGLLKINTGGVGVSAPHSVVAIGKMVYFMHASGFHRFDGLGAVLISRGIRFLFDPLETTYYIPPSRYPYIQARFNRVWNTVEWTVSQGSGQATNNKIYIFDTEHEGWWIDSIVAASLLKTEDSNYTDLYYHGDYAGKAHQDYTGTDDNGTAITASVTTRAMQDKQFLGWLSMFRGYRCKLFTESAGTVDVQVAAGYKTTFTDLGTISLVQTGQSAVIREYYDPILGTAFQMKFIQTTDNKTFALSEVEVLINPIREIGVNT